MRSELLGVEIPTTLTEDGLNIITHDTLRRVVREYPRLNITLKPLTLTPQMCVFEATALDTDTGRKETEIGESNPVSLKTEISKENPAVMAYYRAYDRALIQLLNLPEGKVYSNNEIAKYKPVKPAVKEDQKQHEQAQQPKQQQSQPKEQKDQAAGPKVLAEAYGCKICENGGKVIIYDVAKKSWLKHKDGSAFAFDSKEKAMSALKQREAKKSGSSKQQAKAVLPDDTIIAFGKFKGKKFGDIKESNEFKEFVQNLKDSPVSYGDGVQAQVDAIKALAV